MNVPKTYDEFDAWIYKNCCIRQQRNHGAFESRRGWSKEKQALHWCESPEEYLALLCKGYYASGDSVRLHLADFGEHILLKDAIALVEAQYSERIELLTAIVAAQ